MSSFVFVDISLNQTTVLSQALCCHVTRCVSLPPSFWVLSPATALSLGPSAGDDLSFARRAQVAAAETCSTSSDDAPEHVWLSAAVEFFHVFLFCCISSHAALDASVRGGIFDV